MVSEDFVCLYQLAYWRHHLAHVNLVRSCGQPEVIQCGVDAPDRDYSVRAVISYLSCA